MGFGAGGGVSGTKGAQTTTNPLTALFPQLASVFGSNVAGLAGGSSIAQGVSALTASSNLQTQQGIANIKESAGASGARFGTSLANSISQFQTQQSTALGTQIAQFQQGAVSNQLAALQEIISAASGTSYGTASQTTGQANFGLGIVCWVAAEIYGGWDDLRVDIARGWIMKHPLILTAYKRWGRLVACLIHQKLLPRWPFKFVFDRIVRG